MTTAYSRDAQQPGTSFQDIKRLSPGEIGAVIEAVTGKPTKLKGNELYFCREQDKKPGSEASIRVDTQLWKIFGNDDAQGGDLVSLVAHLEGVSQIDALKRVCEILGLPPPAGTNPERRRGRNYDRTGGAHQPGSMSPGPAARAAEQEAERVRREQEEVREAAEKIAGAKERRAMFGPAEGTDASQYLVKGRLGDNLVVGGKEADLSEVWAKLLFCPAAPHPFGAHLGLYPTVGFELTNPITGEMTAIVSIPLDATDPSRALRLPDKDWSEGDNPNKQFLAKKVTRGSIQGSCLIIGTPGETLYGCEGMEDGVSIHLALGGQAVLVAGSSSYVGKAQLPPGVKTFVYVPDQNRAGEEALRLAHETYAPLGVRILVARMPSQKPKTDDRPGATYDANLVWRELGPDKLAECLRSAVEYRSTREADPANDNSGKQNDPRPNEADDAAETDDDASSSIEIPSDLLDIPGPLGDIALYLRDRDDASDPAKAFVTAVAIFTSLTNGVYEVHAGGKFITTTDINMISVATSGTGKTTALRDALKIVRGAYEDSTSERSRGPLRVPPNLGSPEGFWDELTEMREETGITAGSIIIDEFGQQIKILATPAHYGSGTSNLLRVLSNAHDTVLDPPFFSKRNDSPPRPSIRFPVIGLYGICTQDQLTTPLANDVLLEDGSEARLMLIPSPSNLIEDPFKEIPAPPNVTPALKDIWHRRCAIANEVRGQYRKPERTRAKIDERADLRIREIMAKQGPEARGHRWESLIRRRVERTTKLALLRAISRDVFSPMVEHEDVEWAHRITMFSEKSHIAMRDGRVVASAFTAEAQDHVLKVIRTTRDLHDKQSRRKGYIGVAARDIMRRLRLPRKAFAEAVDSAIHQGELKLLSSQGIELGHYPAGDGLQRVLLKPARAQKVKK